MGADDSVVAEVPEASAQLGQAAEAPTVPSEPPCRPRTYLPGWPFLLYVMAWAGLAAATLLMLAGPEAPLVPLDDPAYPALLATGLALVAAGPALSLVVWAFARAKAPAECRQGLLTTALVRGAAATLGGVVMWWGALLLVDALRLGLVR